MKKILILLIIFNVQCSMLNLARADGEERSEAGTQWVDPVAFYDLLEVEGGDYEPDYDQGNVEFVNVLREKGLKVYGMKLKPIAVAGHVEGVHPIGELDDIDYVYSFPYKDIMGIRGIPINDPSFCIYTDGGVNRTYSCKYNYTETLTFHYYGYDKPSTSKEEMRIEMTFNLTDMRIVPVQDGLGVSYGMNVTGRYEGARYFNTDKGQPVRASKETGVDLNLGHFIYKTGSQHLLLILSADQRDNFELYLEHLDHAKPLTSEQNLSISRPWARVYFEVEEILVQESDELATLDEDTRKEYTNLMQSLMSWLKGEGDPFGFGEHSGPKVAIVVSTISTIASILLGNGLAGIINTSSSSMIDSIVGSGTPPQPSTPDPRLDALEPKRKEDEEDEKEDKTPPTPEEKLDFFDKYSRTDADGDIVVRDPVTGKETLYINNGDGTYRNFNTDQNWTPDEINEQLRYRDENSGPLKQDAETAARNAAEQHAQWEKESQELSKDGQDYLKWKHEQEAAEKKQEQINKLAQKYGVPPTEKAVKNAIKYEQAINQIDADTYKDLADQYDKGIKTLEIIDKTCEIGVNVMSGCIPGGSAVKNAYTFAKSTLVAASEAVAEGKSASEGVAHVLVGMGNGALGVIQNQAGDLAGNGKYAWAKELGINVITEDLKEGMNGLAQGKSIDEIGRDMITATGKTTASFGVGKLISGTMGKLKETVKDSLDPTQCDPDKFYFSESTAKKLDYWFNKEHVGYLGHRTDVIKVKVDGDSFSIGKGQGFSIFYSGKVNTGAFTEGVIGEVYSNTVGNDWGGRVANWANDKMVGGAANVMYGASKAADMVDVDKLQSITDRITKFSDTAAAFRKK